MIKKNMLISSNPGSFNRTRAQRKCLMLPTNKRGFCFVWKIENFYPLQCTMLVFSWLQHLQLLHIFPCRGRVVVVSYGGRRKDCLSLLLMGFEDCAAVRPPRHKQLKNSDVAKLLKSQNIKSQNSELLFLLAFLFTKRSGGEGFGYEAGMYLLFYNYFGSSNPKSLS